MSPVGPMRSNIDLVRMVTWRYRQTKIQQDLRYYNEYYEGYNFVPYDETRIGFSYVLTWFRWW